MVTLPDKLISQNAITPAFGDKQLRIDISDCLSSNPILKGLSSQTLSLFAKHAQFQLYAIGSSVFDRGSTPTGLYLVISGGVKLLANGPDGRTRTIELFEENRMFGEIGVFTQQAYRTWTETTSPTCLLHVDQEAIHKAISQDHEFALRMLTAVTQRTQRLIDFIGVASSSTADVRLAAYLLDLAGNTSQDEVRVTLPATKGTIASLLNLQLESLSRALGRLRDAGLIGVTGRRIHIRSPQKMRALTAL